LDLLPPKSPPTGAFEVMIVRSVGKTAFYQMPAARSIAARRGAVGLGSGYI